jgi:hypothetical protein
MPKDISVTKKTSTVKNMVLEGFRGVDLTSDVTHVEVYRSPQAPNMMPGADGYPAKRPGYHTVCQLDGAVHGAYSLHSKGERIDLVHAGTKLYKLTDATATAVCTDMADANSTAVQLGGKLWILDGKKYRYFDGEQCAPVSEIATVPLITIAKAPNGQTGATSYKPVNLLTGKRTESYLGTADDTAYYLSFADLTDTEVTAQKLDSEGAWVDMAEGTDFEVDRTLGKVTFKTAPGESPVEGEDNVQITYETEGKADTVNAQRLCILYGVSGAMDRIFLAGGTDEPNVDWWSEWNDPAYIGDTNYGSLGGEKSAIVGYSVLSGSLVTHKADEENERNVFVRTGSLDDDGNAVFALSAVVQGVGAVSERCFGSVASEPLYLSNRGVTALTPNNLTGERYACTRSYYINSALSTATDAQRAAACAVVWGRFYALAIGERLYLLDSEQKYYQAREPQSGYQMECYYWTGINATALWVQDGRLRFGTNDGAVREFWPGEAGEQFNDCDNADGSDPRPVEAQWCTPMMNLGTWANLKNVKGVWVVCQPFARSGAVVSYATDKEHETDVREQDIDILDWDDVDFSRFTFNTLDRPTVIYTRKGAKKVKLFQVRVRNDRESEPFGLYAVHVRYQIGGKIRR